MNRFLSITNLLVWALFGLHTRLIAEDLALPTIRQQGSSLSLSLANEADHATRQAKIWLSNHPPLGTATQTCALVQLALGNFTATNVMQIVELAGLTSRTNQAQALLENTLASYPPRSADPETLWLLSHAINQQYKGLLLRKTEVLDWRNDFAQLLLGAHRKDPAGGSYWDSPVPSTNCCPAASAALPASEALMTARIRATAFGLLALKEIHE